MLTETSMQAGTNEDLDVVPYIVASSLPSLGYDTGSRYCYVIEKKGSSKLGFHVQAIKGPYDMGSVHDSVDLEKYDVISAPTITDFMAWAYKKGVRLSVHPSSRLFWHIKDTNGHIKYTKVAAVLSYKNLMKQITIYACKSLEEKEKLKKKEERKNENSSDK